MAFTLSPHIQLSRWCYSCSLSSSSANSCLDFVSAVQLIKYSKVSILSETTTWHLRMWDLLDRKNYSSSADTCVRQMKYSLCQRCFMCLKVRDKKEIERKFVSLFKSRKHQPTIQECWVVVLLFFQSFHRKEETDWWVKCYKEKEFQLSCHSLLYHRYFFLDL